MVPVEDDDLLAYEKKFSKSMTEKFDAYVELKAKLEAQKDSGEDYKETARRLFESGQELFEDMSKMRHDIGLIKVPIIKGIIEDAIDQDNHKVVVFTWHRDVTEKLCNEFPGASLFITGETPVHERQAIVERFQTDPAIKVIVGTIKAMGVGFTLTASSHVIFAEFDWVPGNLTQAEDRCHRIGQKGNVLIQHFVLNGSLEARIIHTVLEKQKIANLILDDDTGINHLVTDLPAGPAGPVLEVVKPLDVIYIHEQIRNMSSVCDGAFAQDEMGFNKFDAKYMKYLAALPTLRPSAAARARNVLLKYHRQLGEEVTKYLKAIEVKGQERVI
jgi:hypothetical protein